jgi:tRNA-binding protein
MATLHDFEQLDIRIGTVVHAEAFPEARKPAIKLQIDFGELGVKKSSAQLTVSYTPEKLIRTQVTAVVNFPPRQIGSYISEVLVLGVLGDSGDVILLRPDRDVPDGGKIA